MIQRGSSPTQHSYKLSCFRLEMHVNVLSLQLFDENDQVILKNNGK